MRSLHRTEHHRGGRERSVRRLLLLRACDFCGATRHFAILDKYTDVGAGAFSDYHSNYFQTTEAVFAGDDIFISYGETWLEGRTYLSHVPLWNNYNTGDELVAFLLALANDTGVEDASLESLYALIKDDFIEDDRTSTVLSGIGSVSDMKAVAAAGGTAATTSTRRSTEWLEENGYCIDHIYVKNSTIPQAGKGGFVRRPIKRGDVILPVQLLHVRGGRDVFHRRTDLSDVDRTALDDKQVYYNYMYSHPDSSVLFMPANAGIVINHGSTRGTTVGAEGKFPNAELKWSTTDRKTQYFLSKAPEDLLFEGYASVVVDFVATRDIAVDEEVLIDYGEEWEEAWNEHVRNWIPPPPTGGVGADGEALKLSSKAIYDMNQHKFDARHWRWSDDHFSVCEENISEKWDEVHLEDFSKQPRFQQFNVTKKHRGFHLASYSTMRTPCIILDGDEGGGTFHVAYFTTKPKKETGEYKLYMVEDLSADEVNFFSIPVRSDSHRSDGHRFSHEIKIPVFPEAWKDMRG